MCTTLRAILDCAELATCRLKRHVIAARRLRRSPVVTRMTTRPAFAMSNPTVVRIRAKDLSVASRAIISADRLLTAVTTIAKSHVIQEMVS